MYIKVHKDVFIDEHKQLDVVKDKNVLLIQIEKPKLYMIEFDENNIIKVKKYPM